MPINFDLNDLQAFRAVVETGSFRKAADTVQITQLALSRRIEKLESALNVKLFERTTRKVSVSREEMYRHDYISLDITSGNRLVLDKALAPTRPPRDSICETRHVTTMIGLVEAGLGVAAVPSIAMPITSHPFLVSVPLVAPEVIRNVGLIKRRGRTLTPALLLNAELFEQFVLDVHATGAVGISDRSSVEQRVDMAGLNPPKTAVARL
ncbi:LysR family transcriptional regulator [Pseudomonas syringae pv. cilantro]|uniref:LysR family transcriptional regulator n=2 Tax=Pseudomonas syringae group TaxID=136849 RepID=A0A0N0GH11_PSESX|nr:LysR family transcriptional regulator [Pseudomonas syringae pv. cilantro]KPW71073.1 LysR family transcriptional regulator [Pseudomonas syringae pv. coriandricola]RMN13702.1 LysR family transcriptional regulator [Pseudomonas syringae pv. coriandricola]